MANDGNMDEEVFVHGNRLTAMRQNNNSGIYKSRSILLKSVVRQEQTHKINDIKDALSDDKNPSAYSVFLKSIYSL
jgi:hypothetical protein